MDSNSKQSSARGSADPLVSAARARQEWGGISPITEWRWRESGVIPRPHRIRGRNYYLLSEIEAVKAAARRPGGLCANPAGNEPIAAIETSEAEG